MCVCVSTVQIFTVSAALDGEAVLLYFGAMCAVSSEELSQPKRRMAFLQRMVHCAHANAGTSKCDPPHLHATLPYSSQPVLI